ncbi:MAG: hypothetical protein V4642_08320 [Bacteroidota bacterium]
MKLSSALKIVFFLISTFQISCGYFENDNIDFQKTIVRNIKIQKQENSKVVNLVFAESDEIYAVIVDNCSEVYYDSNHNQIFVEKAGSSYYEIDIANASAKRISDGLQKKVISRDVFLKSVTNKLLKIDVNF